MEKTLQIKTKDNHIIYGNLSRAKNKSEKLVIFVHGFTGNRNEHQFFNGAKYFNGKGFDAFRFDLYTYLKGARHFEKTKLSQHGGDINEVVNYFKNKYEKIYLVGHSFGGTSLLFVDTKNVNAMVFWDPSYVIPKAEKKAFPFDKKINSYSIDFGVRVIVGKDYINELFDFPDCGELISKIDIPVKFIGAESKEGNSKDAKKYYDKAHEPKSFSAIKNADHGFNTFEAEAKLFDETYNWIKKY